MGFLTRLVVDLNCDLGESFGVYKLGLDEEVIKYVTSANIACGWHAGDPNIMDYTVKLALENGVCVGAHPGFPDLAGFGRRRLEMEPEEVRNSMLYQIGALAAFAKSRGGRLQHVKAHGALNNMAAKDYGLAVAIGAAIKQVGGDLIYVAVAGSAMYRAGRELGLRVAGEVFADRAYNPDGSLVSRKNPGAMIKDPETVTRRVIKMITEGKVTAIDGREVELKVDTVCVHGDNPRAVELVKHLRTGLERNGIEVRPMKDFIS